MKDREELLEAYNVLVAFQLWRRGAIDGTEPNTPQEYGEALDVALGVMWEVINIGKPDGKQELDAAIERGDWLGKRAEVAEQALKSCEAANEYLKKELDKTEGYLKISDDAKEAANNLLRAAVIERDNLKTELAKVEAERDKARAEVDNLVKKYFHDRAQEDADADPTL